MLNGVLWHMIGVKVGVRTGVLVAFLREGKEKDKSCVRA